MYKNPEICNKLITKEEQELYLMKKLSSLEIENLKIERIKESELEKFTETDLKAGYLFYLMRAGYSYSEKIIKSNASDVEFAYISENNDKLKGFDTKIDWVRVYPYGETMRSILGSVSSSSQGIPKEEKDYFLKLWLFIE